jgi:hypothetical protein
MFLTVGLFMDYLWIIYNSKRKTKIKEKKKVKTIEQIITLELCGLELWNCDRYASLNADRLGFLFMNDGTLFHLSAP